MQKSKSRSPLRLVDIAVVIVTVGAVGFGIYQYTADDSLELCGSTGTSHEIAIKHGVFARPDMSVQRCDIITVVNQDKDSYLLAFGNHERHEVYPGFESRLLTAGDTIIIDALKEGTFTVHDHKRDKASLQLTVEPFKD